MADAIDRIFTLKSEAAKRGVSRPESVEGFKLLAGRDFVADLLLDARMRTTSIASLRSDTATVFGIPLVPSNTVAPNALKLVFELDG